MGFLDRYPYTNFHEINLDWILRTCKHVLEVATNLEEWRREHEQEYQDLVQRVGDLENWMEKIEAGEIPESIITGLGEWLDKNMEALFSRAIKFVWFGLTKSGYFVAYIPESWQELTFDTCMDFSNEYYGHLLICYEDEKLQDAETYHRAHIHDHDLDNYWNKEELRPYGG